MRVFKPEPGQRLHLAGRGTGVAQNEQSPVLRHSGEGSIFVVDGEKKLIGGAGANMGCYAQSRRSLCS